MDGRAALLASGFPQVLEVAARMKGLPPARLEKLRAATAVIQARAKARHRAQARGPGTNLTSPTPKAA